MKTSLSIAKQINMISRSLIVGLVVLSVVAVGATLLIRQIFVEYRETARASLLSNAILEDMFEARLAALKWRVAGEAAQVDEIRGNIEEIREVEADVQSIFGADSTFAAGFAAVREDIGRYEAEFTLMLQAHDRYLAAEELATNSGLEARRALTQIMTSAYADDDATAAFYAGRVQESLMLGRYYLERFRQTEASSDVDRAYADLVKAGEALTTLQAELQNPSRQKLAAVVETELTALRDSKEDLVAAVADRMSARESMDQIGPRIVAAVDAVVDAQVDRQNTLGPQGQIVSLWAVILTLFAAVAVVFVGQKVSGRIALRLTKDIEESVDVMTQIADGDLEAEVKNAELNNEIGRMARALEAFKTNGKAAIAEALKEQEAEEAARTAEDAARRTKEEAEKKAQQEEAEATRRAMIASLSRSVGDVVASASEGDFSKRVDAKFDDQELTKLGEGVNTLVKSVDEGLSATREILGKISDGDLTKTLDGEFKGAFFELQTVTNKMVTSLKSLVGDIVDSGTTLGTSSGELQESSASLSRQAEQNAAAIEETSAALEELTASLNQVNENVSEANENVRATSKTAKSSGEVAQSAADAMTRIAEASTEISQVVSVINDIAFQINLLALNAGVEAARAGSAGQGFSVVAAEVRQLSQRASEAAKEIANVIDRSDTAVAEGVEKVADAQSSLAKISESVVGISDRIGDVANSIKEQVLGVSEINNAISQVDQNTQRQAATAEELTASSSLLASESGNLLSSTARFEIGKPTASQRSKPAKASDAGAAALAPTELQRTAHPIPASASNLAVEDDDWEDF